MARSIYQGSAAAVCQARELSARRRARGLEKKATGSFPLSLCLSLLYPPVLPLSFPFSLFHVLVRGLSLVQPAFLSFSLPLYLSIFLFLALSPLFRPLSPSLYVACFFPLFRCFWGNFSSLQRTTEAPRRRRRRCRETYTKTRARATPARG